MGIAFKAMARRAAQEAIIRLVRPYVRREFPGWGRVYAPIADYRRDWLWASAPVKISRGRLHGYLMHLDLSTWSDRSTYFLGRWSNLEMQLLLSDVVRRGDVVADVGANRGNFALYVSHALQGTGEVVCFEPNPACVRLLQAEIATNGIQNITVHPVGLGDGHSTLMLSVPSSNWGEGTFGNHAHHKGVASQVTARIAPGDEWLETKDPVLIKIDVEGFEARVIAGLRRTIARSHPILVTEVGRAQLNACGSTPEELVASIASLGYHGFTLCLRKVARSYTWRLTTGIPRDRTVDVAWIHPQSPTRCVETMRERIEH